jgi:hypothetical protein
MFYLKETYYRVTVMVTNHKATCDYSFFETVWVINEYENKVFVYGVQQLNYAPYIRMYVVSQTPYTRLL